MSTKAKVKKVVKNAKKKETKQRLVAFRNVERMLKEGWKIIKDDARDERNKLLGVRTNVNDLVLMEKEV